MKTNWTSIRISKIKDMSSYMRGWLSNYYSKLFPNANTKLSEGTRLDSPKIIPNDLLDNDTGSD